MAKKKPEKKTVTLVHPTWKTGREFDRDHARNIFELQKHADAGIRLAKGETLDQEPNKK